MSTAPIHHTIQSALAQRVLSQALDPEAAKNLETTRRHEGERLRLALHQAIGMRDAAQREHTSLYCPSRLQPASQPVRAEDVAAAEAKVADAEANLTKCAEELGAFVAAEEMRTHGLFGEVVRMLMLTAELQASEIANLRAALVAAGITIP